MEVRLTRSSEHWSDFQSKNPFHLTEKDYVDAIEAFELMDVISASASPAAGPGLDITTNDDDDDDASWILYLVCLLELNQLSKVRHVFQLKQDDQNSSNVSLQSLRFVSTTLWQQQTSLDSPRNPKTIEQWGHMDQIFTTVSNWPTNLLPWMDHLHRTIEMRSIDALSRSYLNVSPSQVQQYLGSGSSSSQTLGGNPPLASSSLAHSFRWDRETGMYYPLTTRATTCTRSSRPPMNNNNNTALDATNLQDLAENIAYLSTRVSTTRLIAEQLQLSSSHHHHHGQQQQQQPSTGRTTE